MAREKLRRFNWCMHCKKNTQHKQVKKGGSFFKCEVCGVVRYG